MSSKFASQKLKQAVNGVLNTRHLPRASFSKTFEELEPRRMLSTSAAPIVGPVYRNYDGSGNNLLHWAWGQAGTALLRDAAAQYADGLNSPAGPTRPGARDISNDLFRAHLAEDIFNNEGMSAFVYAWGQFIDHDLDLTNNASPAVPLNIPVPQGDGFFDQDGLGNQVIGFNRSQVVAGTGVTTPRQQPNSVTAYIDGSMVYGSDAVRAAALRTFQHGLLKSTDNGTELPYNTEGLDNQTGGPGNYFLAGDVRANENSELTSLQVLFMREHNRLATIMSNKHPHWNDEKVYQETRRLVIGEIQNITYSEFLPSFLGSNPLPKYTGYKPNVNAQVSTEFSTAAFRFGHSILGDDVQFFDDDANTTKDDLKLDETFFTPDQQLDGGTDGLLKYLAAVSSQESDLTMVNGIRNFLFGPPGAGGFDLPALDVQRGRDHGIADYNTERAAMGLKKVTSFDQITSNPGLQFTLQSMYGSVDNIDLFVGGMIEDKPAGAVLGPTFQRIIADQFRRSRDGDRFFFQRDLSGADLQMVQNTTLTDVIRNNSTITNLQKNAFHFDVRISGHMFIDNNNNGKFDKHDTPIVNQNAYLFDGDGVIQHPVQSDSKGFYEYTRLQVDDYTMSIDIPDGYQLTVSPTTDLLVNTDIQYKNQDFGIRPIPGLPQNSSPLPTPGSIVPGFSNVPIGLAGGSIGNSPIDDLLGQAS